MTYNTLGLPFLARLIPNKTVSQRKDTVSVDSWIDLIRNLHHQAAFTLNRDFSPQRECPGTNVYFSFENKTDPGAIRFSDFPQLASVSRSLF